MRDARRPEALRGGVRDARRPAALRGGVRDARRPEALRGALRALADSEELAQELALEPRDPLEAAPCIDIEVAGRQ